jgi:pimeloyl-ACP methyl ester carboxylesterase
VRPSFLGTADNRIFGVYHSPANTGKHSKSILLCHPFGHEYLCSYRIIRQLSDQLSRQGHHVLRFDWYGYGDSDGKPDKGNYTIWLNNIKDALDELLSTSGHTAASVVGLRMAGNLLSKASNDLSNVKNIILWDPVLSGKHWLNELKELHNSFLNKKYSRLKNLSSDKEFLGFPFSSSLQQEISSIDIPNHIPGNSCKLHLILSDGSNNCDSLVKKFQSIGTYEIISAPDIWNNHIFFDRVIMSSPAIAAIVQYFNELTICMNK